MTAGSSWTASEARDGSWSVQHADGRRRYTGFSDGEARVIAAALNGIRRVKITDNVFVRGQAAAAGAEFDLPLADARELVASKRAVFVA
ncbi:MAG: hypothetical protein ACREMF_03125 [Gemmatimonadales bacterium]